MMTRRKMWGISAGLLTLTALLVGGSNAQAQMHQQGSMDCPMMGRMGPGSMGMMGHRGAMRGGMMGGMGMMGRTNHLSGMADMGAIHSLFAQSGTIRRTVKILPDGIEAVTESSDPETARLLQVHVAAMKERLEQNQPIRQGDPLFAALFQNADKIQISITPTARGVKVTETSEDAYTVKLLQRHAQAVTGFVQNGMAGMHTFHPVPPGR